MAGTLGIDTHNHIDVPLIAAGVPRPDLDLAGELKRSGLSAICATFAVDYQRLGVPGLAYDRFQNALNSMDAQLARNKMQRALNLKELQASHDQGQPIIVQAVEGAHFLEGKLERVEEAYKRGLRLLDLFHGSDASTPLGDLYTAPAHLGGLTEFGANVIKGMQPLGHRRGPEPRQRRHRGRSPESLDSAGAIFPTPGWTHAWAATSAWAK